MSSMPYGITTYCDDIRNELGGKLTLVGCYSGEMQIVGQAPTVLPMICIVVNMTIPIDYKFEILEIVVLSEFKETRREMARAKIENVPPPTGLIDSPEGAEGRHISIAFPAKFSPFEIIGPGFLRTRAFLDGHECKLGSLRIDFVDQIEGGL